MTAERDLDAEIDALARDIERAIQDAREVNARYEGVFEPRSDRSRKMEQIMGGK